MIIKSDSPFHPRILSFQTLINTGSQHPVRLVNIISYFMSEEDDNKGIKKSAQNKVSF